MSVYYNEFDPYAAAWLRNLIAAGHIADGVVDERSIVDVQPEDLAGFSQVHLFAGLGGWSHAARLAHWPDDKPLWTGSCPCQPFSAAGKQRGTADERHLWPEMHLLVAALRPPVVVGEQVASRAGLDWLDGVCSDLEAAGYATGAIDLCAASVGAPHIRQRLWWVAHSPGAGPQGSESGWGPRQGREGTAVERGSEAGFWSAADWMPCRDGKARPVEPGSFPLVDRATARVGRLRAYGNAIVPQVAAEILTALLDMEKESSCYSD